MLDDFYELFWSGIFRWGCNGFMNTNTRQNKLSSIETYEKYEYLDEIIVELFQLCIYTGSRKMIIS